MSASKMTDALSPLPQRWRTVLIASLLLNLFCVALTTGFLLHGRHHGRLGAVSLARALANAGASLSGSDATVFNNIVQRDAPRYAEAAQALAKSREELRHQIAADPFNPVEAKQAYAAWQTSLNMFIDDIGDTLIDALNKISPRGRRTILDERRHMSDPPDQVQ
jgi:hypothetical protein